MAARPDRLHRRLAADYVIWADRLDEEIEGLFAAINQRRPPGGTLLQAGSGWKEVAPSCWCCPLRSPAVHSLQRGPWKPGNSCTATLCPHPGPPAGVPELPVPRPEEVEKFNVAARCEEESQRQTESYTWGSQTYATLAPAANERHCELREYYGSQHPQCLAQLNHFMEADLRLLMGGPILQSSGGGSSAVGSGGLEGGDDGGSSGGSSSSSDGGDTSSSDSGEG